VTSRRRFIQRTSLAAAATLGRRAVGHTMPALKAGLPNVNPDSLARFVDPLPSRPPFATEMHCGIA
jgi:hypothetical protein